MTNFIHHRIDTRFFQCPANPQRPQRPLVLSVGDDRTRDFKTIIEAAREIDADLVLKTRFPAPEILPTNVRFLQDRIDFKSLMHLYSEASLAVVSTRPTIHASGVRSLFESMAMSVPTVVTANAALEDYFRDGQNCILVPPGDVSALRSAIRSMLTDAARSAAIARGGRLFVEENCSLEN